MIAKLSVIVEQGKVAGDVDDANTRFAYLVADTGLTLHPTQASLIGHGATSADAVIDLFDQINLDLLFEELRVH